ncbi:MAG: hypothetical protein ACREMB_18745 [Candidatus Rokuibacteriota bacterium]
MRHLPWWIFGVMLMAVPFLLPAAAAADGGDPSLVHACVNPSGLVRLTLPGGNCRHQEVSYHWPATPPAGTSSPGSGHEPVHVVDSSGNEVGPVIGPGVVGVPAGDFWLTLSILRTGFPQSAQTSVWYTTSDCSGEAYLFATPGQLFRAPAVIGTMAIYASEPVVQRTLFSMKSVTPAQPQGGACTAFATSFTAGPAAALDLTTLGTPPFAVGE